MEKIRKKFFSIAFLFVVFSFISGMDLVGLSRRIGANQYNMSNKGQSFYKWLKSESWKYDNAVVNAVKVCHDYFKSKGFDSIISRSGPSLSDSNLSKIIVQINKDAAGGRGSNPDVASNARYLKDTVKFLYQKFSSVSNYEFPSPAWWDYMVKIVLLYLGDEIRDKGDMVEYLEKVKKTADSAKDEIENKPFITNADVNRVTESLKDVVGEEGEENVIPQVSYGEIPPPPPVAEISSKGQGSLLEQIKGVKLKKVEPKKSEASSKAQEESKQLSSEETTSKKIQTGGSEKITAEILQKGIASLKSVKKSEGFKGTLESKKSGKSSLEERLSEKVTKLGKAMNPDIDNDNDDNDNDWDD